ncbi:ABC transporter ATP-binding protein [Paenibacillus sp. FSL R5-0473]|uniref:ABC transporter ATP-binding protein n=1 Tax=Paenibacillus sp. FSL R5-0473 TaxID=2921642 RepID=UPI0030F8C01E
MQLKMLIKPIEKEKLLVFIAALLGILTAGLNLSRPVLLGMIIGVFSNGVHKEKLDVYILLYFMSYLATWTLSLLVRYMSTKLSQKILVQLRLRLFSHYLHIPFIKREKIPSGRIEAMTSSDLPMWSNLYGMTLIEAVHSVAQFLGALLTMQHFNLQLMLMILPFIVLSAFIPILSSRLLIKINQDAQEKVARIIEILTDFLHGSKELVTDKSKTWARDKYSKGCKDSLNSEVRKNVIQSALQNISAATEILAYITILIFGGRLVLNGTLNISEMVAFLAIIELLFFPARYANDLYGSMQASVASAKRVNEIFKIEKENSDVITSNVPTGVHAVSFKYRESEENILDHVSFDIKPGSLTFIIGESGSGKSTLLKLLAGYYQPRSGHIERLVTNNHFSFVWQEPYLFNASLLENVKLGENIIPQEIEKNIKHVNITNLVGRSSEGYNSMVSNGGGNLSGGEKRRLAMVRSLVRDSELVIMDEPTSGLDHENASMVWELITKNMNSMTRIITTHDLTEVSNADQIVVLSKGKAVEIGSHQELILKKGFYYNMYTRSLNTR